MNRRLLPIGAAIMLTAIAGCPGTPSAERRALRSGADTDDVKVARSESGPVAISLECRPARPRLSDEITLTLIIDHDAGIRVRRPNMEDALAAFVLRDFRERLPRGNGPRQVLRQTFMIEPRTAGSFEIAPYPAPHDVHSSATPP